MQQFLDVGFVLHLLVGNVKVRGEIGFEGLLLANLYTIAPMSIVFDLREERVTFWKNIL